MTYFRKYEKPLITLSIIGIVMLSIPLTLSISRESQDIRSHAAVPTPTLRLFPTATPRLLPTRTPTPIRPTATPTPFRPTATPTPACVNGNYCSGPWQCGGKTCAENRCRCY